jgi:hypothetical protein
MADRSPKPRLSRRPSRPSSTSVGPQSTRGARTALTRVYELRALATYFTGLDTQVPQTLAQAIEGTCTQPSRPPGPGRPSAPHQRLVPGTDQEQSRRGRDRPAEDRTSGLPGRTAFPASRHMSASTFPGTTPAAPGSSRSSRRVATVPPTARADRSPKRTAVSSSRRCTRPTPRPGARERRSAAFATSCS